MQSSDTTWYASSDWIYKGIAYLFTWFTLHKNGLRIKPLMRCTALAVRGQHRAGPLVPSHDYLPQFLGSGEGQLAHPQIVEDEQVYGHQELHVLFAGTVESSFGQFIEQGVGLAVEHAIPLLDGGMADGLGQVAFAGAGRTRHIVHIISRP